MDSPSMRSSAPRQRCDTGFGKVPSTDADATSNSFGRKAASRVRSATGTAGTGGAQEDPFPGEDSRHLPTVSPEHRLPAAHVLVREGSPVRGALPGGPCRGSPVPGEPCPVEEGPRHAHRQLRVVVASALNADVAFGASL